MGLLGVQPESYFFVKFIAFPDPCDKEKQGSLLSNQ